MPTTDVNAALAAYQSATDSTRSDRERGLIKALEHYAKRIVWLQLRQDRPEVVNEAVQYVMAHLADFRGDSKFSTWVYSVVQRYCYRELQLKINSREALFSAFPDFKVEGLASYELDGHARIDLDRLTKTLSKEQRNLINYKLQGYTSAEIAQLLKISTATVESRWRRLCTKLRKLEAERTETHRKQN